MKKKPLLIIALLAILVLCTSVLSIKKRTGNSHLEYLYGYIKDVRSESIIIVLTRSFSESNDLTPRQGDEVYLFIPLKEVQEELLNSYEKGGNVRISVYDSNSIHNSNGLYSVVIMNSDQISKSGSN
ncbi:hypothetical protein [uncultured Enterococcus sp.]|uniref:hypothetical protein n=1 Tax=uncultured Enterococcus sp. TaxID=167972 RepID=UPI002AA70FC7|nr:hypothetical protein [uncultured Enterococcus sp.]